MLRRHLLMAANGHRTDGRDGRQLRWLRPIRAAHRREDLRARPIRHPTSSISRASKTASRPWTAPTSISQIVPIAASSYADKLSALLLGGDIPDIIYFQGGDQKMVEQGILEDLNPLIANTDLPQERALRPHNVERLKNYPYLLYIFPPRAPQPVIRTDWLEKLGGKKPETVDEYTALFQAIHDGDLDGDGTAGNTLGLTAYRQHQRARRHLQPGVRRDRHLDEGCRAARGSIPASPTQEKAKIAYYADLAAKGLFDKEYVTNKFDVKEDKFYTGKAGVIFGSSAETVDIYGGKMAAGPSGRRHHADAAAGAQGPGRPGPPGRGREQGKPRLGDLGTVAEQQGSGHEGHGLPGQPGRPDRRPHGL